MTTLVDLRRHSSDLRLIHLPVLTSTLVSMETSARVVPSWAVSTHSDPSDTRQANLTKPRIDRKTPSPCSDAAKHTADELLECVKHARHHRLHQWEASLLCIAASCRLPSCGPSSATICIREFDSLKHHCSPQTTALALTTDIPHTRYCGDETYVLWPAMIPYVPLYSSCPGFRCSHH